MKVVGLDLAWGARARSGVATVDAAGRLLEVASVRSDDEIARWVGSSGPVLVAIDAPLIVRNERGRRPCEAAVSRAFGAQHAGAHSSNLAMPAFRGGGRAARLARGLGLSVDPALPAEGRRVAVEVYPHPALVALFDLPASLAYKAKHGRSVERRRKEFDRLTGCLESLAAADPPLRLDGEPWRALRAQLAEAHSGAALDRVEDRVDAVVCAYIGLLHLRRAAGLEVVGDVESGYILTPVRERHRNALREWRRTIGAEVGARADRP